MNNVLNYNRLQNVEGVVKGLEQLLADYQVYYTNLRGFHWNVQGHAFYQLHPALEGMYDQTATRVDDIAERILQLGGTPTAQFSEYLKVAKVQEAGVVHCPREIVASLLETIPYLVDQ